MASHYAIPRTFDTNPDGFSHPAYGGTLAVKSNTVVYTDTTKTLFALPVGAVIVTWIVNVSTAFNSSGTDLLDIGISGTTQKYAAALNVAATGQIVTGYVAAELGQAPLTGEVTVIATYTESVADASAGALTVTVLYYLGETTG